MYEERYEHQLKCLDTHHTNLCDVDDDDDDTHMRYIYSIQFKYAPNVFGGDSSSSVPRNSPRINFLRLLEVVNLRFVEKCWNLYTQC